MIKFNRLLLLSLLSLFTLPFIGVSCVGSTSTRVGGIHVSEDSGKLWTPSNTILTAEGESSLARFDITELLQETNEPSTLYAATAQAGLYKSTDGAKSWFALTTTGRIESVDVHPKLNSLLVASRANQIFVSKNSGEVWDLMYTDPANSLITDVKFHTIATNHIIAATNKGTLLESTDQGRSWRLLYDFKKPIQKISMHPQLATGIYVLLSNGQIHFSDNTGKSFSHITEDITSIFTNAKPLDFIVHPKDRNQIIFATANAIYKTTNLGQDWTPLPLLSTANEAIQSIGWDPQKIGIVYYATPNVFYRSTDGGTSWETSIFNSNKLPKQILIHPENSEILIIATRSE